MTVRIRQARPADIGTICRLRLERTAWLAEKGSDQWTRRGRGLSIDRFARAVADSVAARETWIVEVDDQSAATVTVNDRADPGLWSPAELADAVFVHYMIVDLRFAGHRVGRTLLAHAAALARARRRTWVRLDAWTTNTDLHRYYRRSGFRLARIADPGSSGPSAALFETRAAGWPMTDHLLRTHPRSDHADQVHRPDYTGGR